MGDLGPFDTQRSDGRHSGARQVSAERDTRVPTPLVYIDCGIVEIHREGARGGHNGAAKRSGHTHLFLTVPEDKADALFWAFR